MRHRVTAFLNLFIPNAPLEARLLSISALGLTILSAIGAITIFFSNPSAVGVTLASFILSFLVYLASFTSYYNYGVFFFSITFNLILYVGVVLSGDYSSDNIGNFLRWTILTVLLVSIYLKEKYAILLTLFNVLCVCTLTLVIPSWKWAVTGRIAGFVLSASIAIIAAAYYRNRIEQERLSALQTQADELARANQELETLLHITSHDLKEPLRAIVSFSEILSNRYSSQIDEKAHDYFQRIIRAARRLRELLDNIIVLSRVRKAEGAMQMVDGETIVQDVLVRLEELIKQEQATIVVKPDLPVLHIRKVWATEAIYNLLTNAIKFSHQECPPIIEVDSYVGSNGVGLVVRDRGQGVLPERRERIFPSSSGMCV